MKAYHNDPNLKAQLIERMNAHILADELITGEGWDGTKGCSVGCLFHAYNHAKGKEIMGTPEWLHHMQDTIHERCSENYRKTFSIRFLQAIPVGANVSKVYNQINIFILKRSIERVEKLQIPYDAKARVIDVINQVIGLHVSELKGVFVEDAVWCVARNAARDTAHAFWGVVRDVVRSDGDTASSAARSAARAAWSIARAARSAADAAESAVESAAWSSEIEVIADKLIELLKAA